MGKVKAWMQDQIDNMTDEQMKEYEEQNEYQSDLFSVMINAHKENGEDKDEKDN